MGLIWLFPLLLGYLVRDLRNHSSTYQPLQTFPEHFGLSVLFYACWRQRIQFWKEKLSETGPNMSEMLANYMIFSA